MEITIRDTINGSIAVNNPILLNGISTCYKCNKEINVFAFSCKAYINKSYYEMPIFSYVTKIESGLDSIINSTRIKKFFYKDYSQTTNSSYYMNHCQYCGAKRGEFYLHEEPSGTFFIQNEMKIYDLSYFNLSHNINDIYNFDATIMIERFKTTPNFKKEKFVNDYKIITS